MNKLLCAFALLTRLAASAQADPPLPAPDTSIDSSAFIKVDIEADYPGGQEAWRAYLMNNLDAEAAGKDLPKGAKNFRQTALVVFVVNANGTLSNISVRNDVIPSIRREAIRVIRKSGKWTPAIQNGRPVRAYRTQPITFAFS